MKVRVSKCYIGVFEAIILSNSNLRAVILPELGGRIWELEDIIRQKQWIWQREEVSLKSSSLGAVYDDLWAGGWEELFPNDSPERVEGRDLPDHGEWWTMKWSATIETGEEKAIVRLTSETTVIKAGCVKEISLEGDASELKINYSIKSEEDKPFHFLFKQHLALNINKNSRLWLPGGHVKAVDPLFSTILQNDGNSYLWPMAGNKDNPVDLRVIPPPSQKDKEFLYVWNMPQAWCGVRDLSKNASIKMNFNFHQLPFVWLFLSYGGWRNCYTVVFEPCTNMPKNLSEAVVCNQSARLGKCEEFKTEISVSLESIPI